MKTVQVKNAKQAKKVLLKGLEELLYAAIWNKNITSGFYKAGLIRGYSECVDYLRCHNLKDTLDWAKEEPVPISPFMPCYEDGRKDARVKLSYNIKLYLANHYE